MPGLWITGLFEKTLFCGLFESRDEILWFSIKPEHNHEAIDRMAEPDCCSNTLDQRHQPYGLVLMPLQTLPEVMGMTRPRRYIAI